MRVAQLKMIETIIGFNVLIIISFQCNENIEMHHHNECRNDNINEIVLFEHESAIN